MNIQLKICYRIGKVLKIPRTVFNKEKTLNCQQIISFSQLKESRKTEVGINLKQPAFNTTEQILSQFFQFFLMKLKRTLPSVQAKVRNQQQKGYPKLMERESDQVPKLAHHVNHISIVNELERKEDEQLAKKYLTKKPIIFKKEQLEVSVFDFPKLQNSEYPPATQKKENSVDKGTFELIGLETKASEKSFSKFSHDWLERNRAELLNQNFIKKKDRKNSADESHEHPTSLQKKVQKLELKLKLLEKQISPYEDRRRHSEKRNDCRNSLRSTSQTRFTHLQLERKLRCENLEKQNALLLEKLKLSNPKLVRVDDKRKVSML